jgi:tritrans,polycis-undecaprenyl-diphosphate synthase [geranylgeranyl-diphosphate specific]|tara:strand:+ start:971 stop:1672 length:702 start_codon:yes stop_codon:yes gene_type:complete
MESKNPEHIAIVLDGNRRYAMKKGLKPWKGHEFGMKKLENLLSWCEELGIKELTLYAFSLDNFKRPEIEKKVLFGLFKEGIKNLEGDNRLSKLGIRIRFLGRLSLFPKEVQEEMHKIMEKTKNYDNFKINLCMAYSGKSEITDALKKIIEKIKNNEIKEEDVDEKLVERNLYLNGKPDILIRPGGEKRLSDFLIWQSAYSELFFLDKLWPEFEKGDLIEVIEEFKQRERRFGE